MAAPLNAEGAVGERGTRLLLGCLDWRFELDYEEPTTLSRGPRASAAQRSKAPWRRRT